MEQGQIVDVYYRDDTQTRHKTLEFIDSKHGLLIFSNSRTGLIEEIPVFNIIRIQSLPANTESMAQKPWDWRPKKLNNET